MIFKTTVIHIGVIEIEIEADNEEKARGYAESYFLESNEQEIVENIYKYKIKVEEKDD